jgi:hypothetical protein
MLDGTMEMFKFGEEFGSAAGAGGGSQVTPYGPVFRLISYV